MMIELKRCTTQREPVYNTCMQYTYIMYLLDAINDIKWMEKCLIKWNKSKMNGCAAEAKTQKHIDYPENRVYEMRLLTFLFLTSYFYWIELSRKTQKSLNICVPGNNATNQTLLYSNSKFMRLSYIETKFRHRISEGKEEKESAREKTSIGRWHRGKIGPVARETDCQPHLLILNAMTTTWFTSIWSNVWGSCPFLCNWTCAWTFAHSNCHGYRSLNAIMS